MSSGELTKLEVAIFNMLEQECGLIGDTTMWLLITEIRDLIKEHTK